MTTLVRQANAPYCTYVMRENAGILGDPEFSDEDGGDIYDQISPLWSKMTNNERAEIRYNVHAIHNALLDPQHW